jgi:ABC-type transport system involved in multi-copper enzyme maturation permease subunit
MKGIGKVFRFELFKLKKNLKLYITIIFGALFVMMFTYLIESSQITSAKNYQAPAPNISELERNNLMIEYRDTIDELEFLLKSAKLSNSPHSIVNHYEKEIYKYKFLVETNTVEKEYIDHSLIMVYTYNYYGEAYLFNAFNYIFYFLIIVTIALTVVVFAGDYSHQTMKNIINSPVKRIEIILGKLLFVFAIITFVFLFMIVLTLCIGAMVGYNDANIITYSINKAVKTRINTVIFSKFLLFFVSLLFAMLISALFSVISKNAFAAFFISLIMIALFIGLSVIINQHFSIYKEVATPGYITTIIPFAAPRLFIEHFNFNVLINILLNFSYIGLFSITLYKIFKVQKN